MGVYAYTISTKNKKFELGMPNQPTKMCVPVRLCTMNEQVAVHPYNFSHKVSYNSWRQPERLRARRLENIWMQREWPQFFAFGGLEDGSAIYSNIPNLKMEILDTEELPNFVGYLRGKGRNQYVEVWWGMMVPSVVSPEQYEQVRMLCAGPVHSGFVSRMVYTVFYTRDEDDMMRLRLLFG